MSRPFFPGKIKIWKEGTLVHVDVPSLVSYLKSKRDGLEVIGPLEIWEGMREAEVSSRAQVLAGSRVFRTDTPLERAGGKPLAGEVAVEERMIRGLSEPVGVLYDAHLLAGTYAAAIAASSVLRTLDPDALHIVLTYRLMGTFERFDRRYHARAACYAFPSIISTTGLVAAPAKPREYYLARNFLKGGLSEHELLRALEGRFLDHGDERTTEVLKGYLLQGLFYHATGNPFCEDPSCRLYNAHWQEEMLAAQLGGDRELCTVHERMLGS